MGTFKDLTGLKFGKLTVIERAGHDKHKRNQDRKVVVNQYGTWKLKTLPEPYKAESEEVW